MTGEAVTVVRGANVPATPRVSVIIPAFQPEWLDEALDSVRGQTLRGVEVIVIDDGSPVPAQPRRTDDLVLVRQSNAGPGGARNRGFALAAGEYVALLDCDDRWRPTKLAEQLAFLDAQPDFVLSSTNWCYLGAASVGAPRFAAGQGPGHPISLERLFLENCICCSATMIRRDALRRTGGMVPGRRFGEDYGLWLELILLGQVGYLDQVLVEKRVHSGSLVHETARDGSWFTEELAVYEEFLVRHPELRQQPFVRRALSRVYFDRGYDHRGRRAWRDARACLTEAIRLDPTHPRAWMLLAATLVHL